jgi:hypothetical protein
MPCVRRAASAMRGIAAPLTINSRTNAWEKAFEPPHSELSETEVDQHATSIG